MPVLYRLTLPEGSEIENADASVLQDLRSQAGGGEIIALQWDLTIANDPNHGATYPDYDTWQARITELSQQFYGTDTKTPMDPQPEGLNPPL